MLAKASLKYIRITPRKFRQIIPLVKGRPAEEAIAILSGVKKGASVYAIELLKSAIANAKRAQQGIDASTLYISKLIADCGPTLKRYRAASMGRASPILKRTSHLTVELDIVKKPSEEPVKTKGKEHTPAQARTEGARKQKAKETRVHKPAHVKKGEKRSEKGKE